MNARTKRKRRGVLGWTWRVLLLLALWLLGVAGYIVLVGERDQAVDTTKAHSIYRLGLVLHEAGRPDEAAGEFERALDLVRNRGGEESKLYRKIFGHYEAVLPDRAQVVATAVRQ